MAAPKKYPRRAQSAGRAPVSRVGPEAVNRYLARQRGVHHEALRHWIRQAEPDAGKRTHRPTTDMPRRTNDCGKKWLGCDGRTRS